MGGLRAGACIVPLSTMAAADALEKMLDDCDAKVLFLSEQYRALVEPYEDRLGKLIAGGRIAYDRVELAERLMDRKWLSSFAPGTVGAAYAEFTARENLSADGLADESRKGRGAEDIDLRHPVAWYGRRIRDVHDLWHILSGYGRDGLGEACLVAFSYPQTKSLGWAFIAFGVWLRSGGVDGAPVRRAIMEGYRRGKAAAWLPGEDYEALMAEPLEAARARLGLTRPAIYESLPPEYRDVAPAAPATEEATLQAA